MDAPRIMLVVAIVAFTALAAGWDARFQKLPNAITVPALFGGLMFHSLNGWLHSGISGAGGGFLFAVGGFATGFGILLVLWLIGGGGGGDVKFMGALGAWLGPQATIVVFLLGTVLIVFCVIGAACWRFLRTDSGGDDKRSSLPKDDDAPRGERGAPGSAELPKRRRLVPYAVPVALATWVVLAFKELSVFTNP